MKMILTKTREDGTTFSEDAIYRFLTGTFDVFNKITYHAIGLGLETNKPVVSLEVNMKFKVNGEKFDEQKVMKSFPNSDGFSLKALNDAIKEKTPLATPEQIEKIIEKKKRQGYITNSYEEKKAREELSMTSVGLNFMRDDRYEMLDKGKWNFCVETIISQNGKTIKQLNSYDNLDTTMIVLRRHLCTHTHMIGLHPSSENISGHIVVYPIPRTDVDAEEVG